MTERLFAVREQREIFLLWMACGFVWGMLTDAAEAVRNKYPRAGWPADAAAVLILLALSVLVLMHTHEGVRLYGLLGVSIGAVLYRSGLSCLLHGAGRLMKKACRNTGGGRKSD